MNSLNSNADHCEQQQEEKSPITTLMSKKHKRNCQRQRTIQKSKTTRIVHHLYSYIYVTESLRNLELPK